MAEIIYTPDEIINTIRSHLKTILVEGKDDLYIYRKIEEELNDLEINILPCGGRHTLLTVYQQKEILTNKTLFICDSDLWHFSGFPLYLESDIITTVGYSIENDIFIDGEKYILNLFNHSERNKFNLLIKEIIKWYSFEVEKHLSNENYDCKFSDVSLLNESILDKQTLLFTENFLSNRNFQPADIVLTENILNNFKVLLRGKYLFQSIEKVFQNREYVSRFNRIQIFELVFAFIKTQYEEEFILSKRLKQIQAFFN